MNGMNTYGLNEKDYRAELKKIKKELKRQISIIDKDLKVQMKKGRKATIEPIGHDSLSVVSMGADSNLDKRTFLKLRSLKKVIIYLGGIIDE